MKRKSPSFVLAFLIASLPSLAQGSTGHHAFTTPEHSPLFDRVERFFTFGAAGKARITLQLENDELLQAETEIADGHTAAANSSLESLAQEQSVLRTLVDSQATGPVSRDMHHLLGDIASDQAAQLTELSSMPATVPEAKTLALTEPANLVHNLSLPNLSADEREIDLTEATSSFSKSSASKSETIAKKINLKNKLEDANASAELTTTLGKVEDTEVAEASHLAGSDLGTLVSSLKNNELPRHNLPFLEKTLHIVGEDKKIAIETALDVQSTQEASKIESDANESDKLTSAQEPDSVRMAVLDRVKAKSSKPEIKDRLDKQIFKGTSDLGTPHADDSELNTSDSSGSKHDSKAPSPHPATSPASSQAPNQSGSGSHVESRSDSSRTSSTPPPTPSASGSTSDTRHSSDSTPTANTAPTQNPAATTAPTATPSSTAEPKSATVSIRKRNGLFDVSSYTVAVNGAVTVQFENDDNTAATLTLSNGISSGPIPQNGKVTLQAFVITGPVSFHSAGGGDLSGSISVQ
jgi:hypothetical protein